VIIDGSNVVSQAQQRFYVHPNDVWTVKLLLYSAGFTARDALFRFPIGTGIHMEYPDGDVKTFNFNSNQEYTSTGLARGIYRVTVIGAKGFAPPTPIALSRNQDVELMVFSYLDMSILGAIGVVLALGLLFFGRPHLMMQAVTFPVRTISAIRKFRPALVKEFYYRTIAFGSRMVSKKGNVRLESNTNAASPESTTYLESEVVISPVLYQAESVEIGSTHEIATAFQNDASDEISDPVMVAEQDDSSSEVSQPETVSVAAEAEGSPEEVVQSELVDAPLETPTNGTGTAMEAEVTHVCQVCGSSELVKKETKRPNQQRYQCQACGASNNFGSKRSRKHRQKNRVESLV